MNDKQRKLLFGVGLVVLLMLICPPYRVHGLGVNSNAIIESGYALIFDLPQRALVDGLTLVVQWIGTVLVGSIGFLLLKDR